MDPCLGFSKSALFLAHRLEHPTSNGKNGLQQVVGCVGVDRVILATEQAICFEPVLADVLLDHLLRVGVARAVDDGVQLPRDELVLPVGLVALDRLDGIAVVLKLREAILVQVLGDLRVLVADLEEELVQRVPQAAYLQVECFPPFSEVRLSLESVDLPCLRIRNLDPGGAARMRSSFSYKRLLGRRGDQLLDPGDLIAHPRPFKRHHLGVVPDFLLGFDNVWLEGAHDELHPLLVPLVLLEQLLGDLGELALVDGLDLLPEIFHERGRAPALRQETALRLAEQVLRLVPDAGGHLFHPRGKTGERFGARGQNRVRGVDFAMEFTA